MIADWTTPILALQQIDDKIRRMKQRVALLPAELQALKQKASANRTRQKTVENAIRETELRIKRDENDIAASHDAIDRLRQKSNLVKKTSEYNAMLGQIADLEKKIDAGESDILTAMDLIEETKKRLRAVTSETDAANASLKAEFGELQTLAADLKKEIARLDAVRPERLAAVPKELLARYQTLLDRDPGLPVVKAIDGICENCHLRLTPQTLNEAKKGQVVYCDNCMHIIYL